MPRPPARRTHSTPAAAPAPAAAPDWIQELVRILARLRAPDGCPWDREQTHRSLKQWLLEESAEFMDAVDDADDEAMCEELGDLLLQLVFHGQIAAERGAFSLQDAARVCCEKLVRRHPHVFAAATAGTSRAVVDQWDRIKKAEKAARGRPESATLAGVPRHLPALHRAHKIQKKAAKVGFDWPDTAGVLAKIEEELAEVREALAAGDETRVRAEIGDLLFSVVNLSRFRDHVAEELLGETIRKFERRFSRMEALLAADGKALAGRGIDELERYWVRAKDAERASPHRSPRRRAARAKTPS